MNPTLPPVAQDVIKLASKASSLSIFSRKFILSQERAKNSEPLRHAIYGVLKKQGHRVKDIAESFRRTEEQIHYGIGIHKTLLMESEAHQILTQNLTEVL